MESPTCGDCFYPNNDDGFVRLCKRHQRLDIDEKKAYVAGIKAAAGYVADFDKLVDHEFKLSDCILAKFNILKRRVRRNR